MGELYDRMKGEFLLRGYSPNTYNGYLCRCRRFAKHFMRSQAEMGESASDYGYCRDVLDYRRREIS